MNQYLLTATMCIYFHKCLATEGTVFLETDRGTIHGVVQDITSIDRKDTVDVFWGIPFAKVPTGKRRFKAPEPEENWTKKSKFFEPPNSCMQVLIDDSESLIPNPNNGVSEDCLYLNVWRPRCEMNENEKFSTLVWIHGGGYMTGSSTVSTYNGAFLAAYTCTIIVSMNYRLGALGFLYLGNIDAPGNMGLLDQVLALQWVKNNIHFFGGSKEKVTIFGNSAGGASVALHLLSPLSRNLFQRAIIQSGSPISHLAQQSKKSALEISLKFSEELGCSEDQDKIAACLQGINSTILTQLHFDLCNDYRYFMTAVPDNYFLPNEPKKLLRNKQFKHTEVLLGATRNEGTLFMGLKYPEWFGFKRELNECLSDKNLNKKLESFFSDFIKPKYLQTVMSDVPKVYKLQILKENFEDGHRILLDFVIGDVINICPVRFISEIYANASMGVFLYSFEHKIEKSIFASWVEVMHGFELDFLFGKPFLNFHSFSDSERNLSKAIMTYWSNFAKTGNPNFDSKSFSLVSWPSFSDLKSHLRFSSVRMNADVFQNERCFYWNNLPDHYILY